MCHGLQGRCALLFAFSVGVTWSSPHHDELQHAVHIHNSPQQYGSNGEPTRERQLGTQPRVLSTDATCEEVFANTAWGTLRIGYEFMGLDSGSAQESFLKDVLVPEAVGYWQKALQVRRTSAPLRVPRSLSNCTKWSYEESFTCAAVNPTTCGLDGLEIPDKYLKAARTCSKRCEVGYGTCVVPSDCHTGSECSCSLSDGLAQGEDYCCKDYRVPVYGGPESCPADCSMTSGNLNVDTSICEECSELPEGEGATDADVFLFVTLTDASSCLGEYTQAYATACASDQCDRPIFGVMNFCKSKLQVPSSPVDPVLEQQIWTAIHEIAHVLGFSSGLFPYFRSSTGTPLVPRDPSDPQHFQQSIRWTCDLSTNQIVTWGGSGSQHFVDPVGIVAAKQARGMDSCPCPFGKAFGTLPEGSCLVPRSDEYFRAPYCVYEIVTPKVVEAVREHFGCNSLTGAELENQPTSSCTMVGSHWEQRVFMSDAMAAIHMVKPISMSKVTLALFEDSGWYKSDYSMATVLVRGRDWGYDQGCTFPTAKCFEGGSTQFPNIWCETDQAKTCSLDRTATVYCSMETYSAEMYVPEQLDYISLPGGAHAFGSVPEADYCPFFSGQITNRDCTDASTASTQPYNNANVMREIFGASSRCLMGNVRGDIGTYGVDDGTMASLIGDQFDQRVPSCYKIHCAEDGASYEVHMDVLDTSGKSQGTALLGICSVAGQQVTSESPLRGGLICADPAIICSTVGIPGVPKPIPTSMPAPMPFAAPTAVSIAATTAAPKAAPTPGPTAALAARPAPAPTEAPADAGSGKKRATKAKRKRVKERTAKANKRKKKAKKSGGKETTRKVKRKSKRRSL